MRILNNAPVAASVSAVVTSAQIFPNSINTAIAAILTLPGSRRVEQKAFTVRASGYVTTGTTTNVTITLYCGTSLTAGSNTVIKASTATAVNTVSCPWSLEAQLILDTVSGKLHAGPRGIGFSINNALTAAAVAANVVTGLSSVTEPVTNFVVGVTFSASDVLNVAHMQEFVLGF